MKLAQDVRYTKLDGYRRQLECGYVVSLGYFEKHVWAIIWIDTYLLFPQYLVDAISTQSTSFLYLSPFSVNNNKRDILPA